MLAADWLLYFHYLGLRKGAENSAVLHGCLALRSFLQVKCYMSCFEDGQAIAFAGIMAAA